MSGYTPSLYYSSSILQGTLMLICLYVHAYKSILLVNRPPLWVYISLLHLVSLMVARVPAHPIFRSISIFSWSAWIRSIITSNHSHSISVQPGQHLSDITPFDSKQVTKPPLDTNLSKQDIQLVMLHVPSNIPKNSLVLRLCFANRVWT